MKLEMATLDEQKGGWNYSFKMLDQINRECEPYGYNPGMEEIEAILEILAAHGIITPPSVKLADS